MYMKRYRLTWLSLVLGVTTVLHTGCQEQTKPPDQTEAATAAAAKLASEKARVDQPAPQITFEKTVYDFGEVSSSKKCTGQFKFTNTGNAPLRITEVKKCCGAVVTLDKKELAPGESGALKVEYNTGRGAGAMMRQLHVSSNDQTNPDVTLTIKARIAPKVDYEPRRINLVLNKENAGCPNITLTSLDGQPFSIKTFQATGDSISADVDPSVEATKFVLQPKVDLEKLQKRSAGFVAINLTHPELDRVTIYFSTQQRFQMTPASIILFNPEPQKPTVKKISVVSNYGQNFEVESTSSDKGLAKVLSQQEIANGYQFEVEIMPPLPDGTGKFTDVLNIQLKGGEKLAIKCYGRYMDLKE
jgi:hypothetical protein